MAAHLSSLGAVMEFVRTGAAEAKLPPPRINQLDLLVEEAMVNVCSHAYPDEIEGTLTIDWSIPAPGELRVEISDRGVEFNPLSAGPPDLTSDLDRRPIGGLGIHLMKTFATSLDYRREDGWNRLTFIVTAGS